MKPCCDSRRSHIPKAGSAGLPRSVRTILREDPGYDDDFQRIREEVNKLSSIDTGLICQLAEKVLNTVAKDVRVATYYCWARLHRDGETGFAEGLELLAGLLTRYGKQLHPQRERSRKPALGGSQALVCLTACYSGQKWYATMPSVRPVRCFSSETVLKLSLKRHVQIRVPCTARWVPA